MRKTITKKILMSFDLTRFLMENPRVAQKYDPIDFVVFSENDKNLNRDSYKLVEKLKEGRKKVVKATRKKGPKNDWHFSVI